MPTNGQRPTDSYEPELTRWRFCDRCWVYWRVEVTDPGVLCWICADDPGRPVASPGIINAYTPERGREAIDIGSYQVPVAA